MLGWIAAAAVAGLIGVAAIGAVSDEIVGSGGKTDFARLTNRLHDHLRIAVEETALAAFIGLMATRIAVAHADDATNSDGKLHQVVRGRHVPALGIDG